MDDAAHILVVDDEPRIRGLLRRYLEQEGFRVSTAEDGKVARRLLANSRIDLILLDLMMPGEDGLVFARETRARSDVPIVMLTGRKTMVDRVVGLEIGADDYIAKPFHLREVLARVRSVLRRCRPASAAPGSISGATDVPIQFDEWRFDLMRRELWSPSGEQVSLTRAEFDLLSAFVRNPNRVLDRDQLMDLAKGQGWEPYDRAIDQQVARLRRKIERDPKNPTLIKTVRGAGYVFTPKVETGPP